jgi:hypothetical protein
VLYHPGLSIDASAGASDCLSTAKHPRKKTAFSIPSFRDLWKVLPIQHYDRG